MNELYNCSTVTIGVIAYNEQQYLPDLLDDILSQTYPHDKTEIILINSESEDNTYSLMSHFKEDHIDEYLDIRVFNNSKKIQPAGWNIVIQNSKADIILRIDAHARLPEEFIENNVACINSGEAVCGGPRENIIDSKTPWKIMLLDAEQSVFGSGAAVYRHETESVKYVNSVFHGAYKKEVFENVGLFNENLIRTEDNEIHYRIRQAGYRICFNPTIKSYYQTRNNLRGMIKQKYGNGKWIGKTLYVCPQCLSLFHFVPVLFVLVFITSIVLFLLGLKAFLYIMLVAYFLPGIVIAASTMISKEKRTPFFWFLPIAFFLMHMSFGIGTIVGIIQGKRFLRHTAIRYNKKEGYYEHSIF